jgi:hypothetical protein
VAPELGLDGIGSGVTPYVRVFASDVRYRFVIDTATF